MYDNRQELKCGSVISHKGIAFEITGLLSCGGNAIAYTAQYSDSVIEGIIKELFPYRPEGGFTAVKILGSYARKARVTFLKCTGRAFCGDSEHTLI